MNEQLPTFKQSWIWRKRWWLVSGFILVVFLFVGSILLVVAAAMKSGDAYKAGLAQAQANKEVVEAMGEPVEPGFFVGGSVNVSGPSGNADLAIPLSGPRGKGTLYLTAEKSAGQWVMKVLEVEVKDRTERINLLNEPQ